MTGLTFGLIGASYVASSRMVPAFAANSIEVKGLFDTDEARFRHWRNQGLDLVTRDLDELLASDIDAVYISSRNEQHAAQSIAAARAGKHVLVEKPMALSLDDAHAMIAAADGAGVQLAVNHHLPGSPLHSTARDLVQAGRIGTLLSARINHAVLLPESLRTWRLQPVAGGGVVFDITVHDASVLNPLFGGPPVSVAATGVSQGAWNSHGTVDSVMTVMEFTPNGAGAPALAQTHDAFTVPLPGTSMEIHGSDGAILIGDAMTQETPGTVTIVTASGPETVEVDCSRSLYDITVRRFAAAVRGEGAPTATGPEGLATLKVAIAVERSLASGQRTKLADLD